MEGKEDTPTPSMPVKRKRARPRKSSKNEIMRMHSESQRLIRESTLKLPQYQPKAKTLDSFLIKLKSVRQTHSMTSSLQPLRKAMPKINPNIVTQNKIITDTSPDASCDTLIDEANKENVTDNNMNDAAVEGGAMLMPADNDSTTDVVKGTNGPRLSSQEMWSSQVEETPVESLQRRFFKHIQTMTREVKDLVPADDGMSQGSVREKLRQSLQKQLSLIKSEERKKNEEMRKENEEEIEEEEEEILEEEEDDESGDGDDESSGLSGGDDNDGDGDDRVIIHKASQGDDDDDIDGDDVLFVPTRKSVKPHAVISDDDDNDDDNSSLKGPVTKEMISMANEMESVAKEVNPVNDSAIVETEEAVVTGEEKTSVVFTDDASDNEAIRSHDQTTTSHDDTNRSHDHNDSSLPVDNHDEATQPIDDSILDTSSIYMLGQSLPAHQLTAKISFYDNDSQSNLTRQNSTVSSVSEDFFRNIETNNNNTFWSKTLLRPSSVISENSQETQFLDSDGLLCIRNNSKVTLASALSDVINTQLNDPSVTQLEALCSGKFQETPSCAATSFANILSLNEANGGGFAPDCTSSDSSLDGSILRVKRTKRYSKVKSNKKLLDYVESEAELSGSDPECHDDEEEDEEGQLNDLYELDEGAESDVPLSDSELRHQVNKAHLKQMVADDRADINEIKNRFLLEGDLYEDGLYMKNGFFRTRKFASEASADLFSDQVKLELMDEDQVEMQVGSQAEALKRKERLEKEEFIRKCHERNESLLSFDEDSQSILELIKDQSSSSSLLRTPETTTTSTLELYNSNSNKRARCGSFLKHAPATLQRISSYTNATPSLNGSGRGYAFISSGGKRPSITKSDKSSSVKHLKHVKKSRTDKLTHLPIAGSSIFDQL
jgi:uncharacterized membrane protein